MKKPYTEVSFEIRILTSVDVLTSSGEPTDDIVFGDIFH